LDLGGRFLFVAIVAKSISSPLPGEAPAPAAIFFIPMIEKWSRLRILVFIGI
jgi:hypothetical protein